MEFSEYYVAYFDILGYKETLKKSENDAVKLIESIESSIDLMKKIVQAVNDAFGDLTEKLLEVEYKIFSDNVLVCNKGKKDPLSALSLVYFLRLVATIQRVFFEGSQLIVRGGITKGPLYLTNDFVGGKALIDAVELESTTIYPRIVVADCILSELNPKIQNDFLKKSIETLCQDLLVKDTDGKSFLNYIMDYNAWVPFPKEGSQSESVESSEELEKLNREGRLRIPAYNPECLKDIFVILRKHKDLIEEKISEYSQSSNDMAEETRLKILKKYLWLASFHNKICEGMYKMPQLKIHLKSEFNELTLAFDVSVG